MLDKSMLYGSDGKLSVVDDDPDISVRETLEERLRFERLLSDFSARFVKISPEQVDAEITSALKMVLEFFQVDRCLLIRTLQERKAWQVTHIAYNEDKFTPVPVGAVLSRAIHPWAYEMLIDKKQVLAITNTAVVGPPEAEADRQTWIEWGTRSTLLIPIHAAELDDYVISINSVRNERGWPEEFIPRVRLLGEIFVNAMERRNAEQALRESEERLDLAAASAGAGIWIMNMKTGSVWATDKLRELYRFAPDEELSS
jgi:PAS domain-containing protein